MIRIRLSHLFLLTAVIAMLLSALTLPHQCYRKFRNAAERGDTATMNALLDGDFKFDGMDSRVKDAEYISVEQSWAEIFTGRISFLMLVPDDEIPRHWNTELHLQIIWNVIRIAE